MNVACYKVNPKWYLWSSNSGKKTYFLCGKSM